MSNEAKVGGLVLTTGVLAVAFAWIIGIQNPFNQKTTLRVTYNFAGGIEVGSPVRVSGIKVGRVENIEFFVPSRNQRIASAFVRPHLNRGYYHDQTNSWFASFPLKIDLSE